MEYSVNLTRERTSRSGILGVAYPQTFLFLLPGYPFGRMFAALQEWLTSLLVTLGLFNKSATILLLGLDNSGKTTLMYKLKYGTIKSFIPTQRANNEEFTLGRVNFKAWDLGGHRQVRALWRDYFPVADGVVFMVDAADRERLEEARQELSNLLHDRDLSGIPALIMANKTDLADALSHMELVNALQLEQLTEHVGGPLQLFRVSLVDGTGYESALQWLSGQL